MSPLAHGSDSDTSLSSIIFTTESTTQSTSRILIRSCKCSNSCKRLRMSTLLVSPSTKDINMLLHSFYNYSPFCTSFKASSYDVSYVLTSANCCINAAHFLCSSPCSPWIHTLLLLSTLNSFSMWFFPKSMYLIPTLIFGEPLLNDMHHAIEAHTLR